MVSQSTWSELLALKRLVNTRAIAPHFGKGTCFRYAKSLGRHKRFESLGSLPPTGLAKAALSCLMLRGR